jgi:hypothetical protein
MERKGTKWRGYVFCSEQNFVMEHFLAGIIPKVHFKVMEQPNPNRIAKTEM